MGILQAIQQRLSDAVAIGAAHHDMAERIDLAHDWAVRIDLTPSAKTGADVVISLIGRRKA